MTTSVTFSKPATLLNARRMMLALVLALFLPLSIVVSTPAHAQSSGSSPQLGTTIQGQSAATPENALRSVVNFTGNVLCPILAGVFVVVAGLQFRSGRGWVASIVTAFAMLCISGLLRLLESFIINSAS